MILALAADGMLCASEQSGAAIAASGTIVLVRVAEAGIFVLRKFE